METGIVVSQEKFKKIYYVDSVLEAHYDNIKVNFSSEISFDASKLKLNEIVFLYVKNDFIEVHCLNYKGTIDNKYLDILKSAKINAKKTVNAIITKINYDLNEVEVSFAIYQELTLESMKDYNPIDVTLTKVNAPDEFGDTNFDGLRMLDDSEFLLLIYDIWKEEYKVSAELCGDIGYINSRVSNELSFYEGRGRTLIAKLLTKDFNSSTGKYIVRIRVVAI